MPVRVLLRGGIGGVPTGVAGAGGSQWAADRGGSCGGACAGADAGQRARQAPVARRAQPAHQPAGTYQLYVKGMNKFDHEMLKNREAEV